MLKTFSLYKIGLGCAVIFGIVHASPIVTMNPVSTYTQGNTWWQNIKNATYIWNDTDMDGLLETGEKVSFNVTLGKKYWGTHDYDALKVWVGNQTLNSFSDPGSFKWDFDPKNKNLTSNNWYRNTTTGEWKRDDTWRKWTGNKTFTFDYTFTNEGIYDFMVSTMCSRDFSSLHGGEFNDHPDQLDWNAWTKDIHKTNRGLWGSPMQGETKLYQLTVLTQKVPEPSSLSLIFLGITGLVGAYFVRRKKECNFLKIK